MNVLEIYIIPAASAVLCSTPLHGKLQMSIGMHSTSYEQA